MKPETRDKVFDYFMANPVVKGKTQKQLWDEIGIANRTFEGAIAELLWEGLIRVEKGRARSIDYYWLGPVKQ